MCLLPCVNQVLFADFNLETNDSYLFISLLGRLSNVIDSKVLSWWGVVLGLAFRRVRFCPGRGNLSDSRLERFTLRP